MAGDFVATLQRLYKIVMAFLLGFSNGTGFEVLPV